MVTLVLLPWAHPRVSGENAFTDTVHTLMRGSSPRERGKRAAIAAAIAATRLIPA